MSDKPDKPKRPASSWAMLVAAHMKEGGKFPKKGTADYDKVRKQLDNIKAGKSSASAAAPKARGRPKKPSGVPMPACDAPIVNEVAALPVAKKPRTRKVQASKVSITKDDEIMEAPAEVVLQAEKKLNRQAKTSTMVAADNLPKVKKSVRVPDLVKDVSEKKGVSATIPLARISGTTGIRIPFTDRLMPTVTVTPGY
jgi:hypothetical protein